jgi:hypothetical protein
MIQLGPWSLLQNGRTLLGLSSLGHVAWYLGVISSVWGFPVQLTGGGVSLSLQGYGSKH